MPYVPLKTNSAPGVSLYAPAGGGGGGPNLSVSSVVVNGTTSSSGGAIAFTYDFPIDSALVPVGMVGVQQGLIYDYAGNATNAILSAVNNNAGGAQTGDFGARQLIIGTQGTGGQSVAKPTIYEVSSFLMVNPAISTPSIWVSSINGVAPGGGGGGPTTSLANVVSPLAYCPPGGSTSAFITATTTPNHSYRIEFPVRVQGWSTDDGIVNNYAPNAEDWLSIQPVGNVVGSPAPVFTTLQMAQVSSIANDWEGILSGTFQTTGTSVGVTATTALSVGYSTSIQVGTAPCYITDLGIVS